MIQAMRNRRADRHAARQAVQTRSDVGDDRCTAACRGFELYVDFRVVHALGVFIEFAASAAPADVCDFRHFEQGLLGNATEAIGLGQGDAGLQLEVDRQRALVERRQETARQCGRHDTGRQYQQRGQHERG